MREYIDRYVHDVIIRLNEEKRAEVKEAIEKEIADKLPKDYTSEDVESVLKSLGHPSELASRYRHKENYLVSPHLYRDYLRILRIVTIFLAVFLFSINFIQYSLALSGKPLNEVILTIWSKSFYGAITGFVYGFTLVTIVFFIIERTNLAKRKVKVWDLSDLPVLSNNNRKEINKFTVIFGIIFNIVFNTLLIFIFYNHDRFVGWYAIIGSENQIGLTVPLFTDYVIKFIPIIWAMLLIQVGAKVFMLTQAYYSIKTDILLGIENILSFSFMIVFFGTSSIISDSFIIEAWIQTNRSFLEVQEVMLSMFKALEFAGVIIALGYLTWMVYRIFKHFQFRKTMNKETFKTENN